MTLNLCYSGFISKKPCGKLCFRKQRVAYWVKGNWKNPSSNSTRSSGRLWNPILLRAPIGHWVKSRIKCSDGQWDNEAASSTVAKVGLGEAKWQLKKTFLGTK